MANYNPKQKVITVHKDPKGKVGYTYYTWESLNLARKDLKPGAFMLWTYIAQNADNFTFGLSSKDFCDNTTMGKSAYDTAVKELIDKQYLVLTKGKTTFSFYERPQEQQISISENQTTEYKNVPDIWKSNNGLLINQTTDDIRKSNNEDTKISPPLFENQTTEQAIFSISENQTTDCLKIKQRIVNKSNNGLFENQIRNIIQYDNNTIEDMIGNFSPDSCEEQTTSIEEKQEEQSVQQEIEVVGEIEEIDLDFLCCEKEMIDDNHIRLGNGAAKPGVYKIKNTTIGVNRNE